MSNLFIIGNGFDLDHHLKTSYEDFRRYLDIQYPNDIEPVYGVPDGYGGKYNKRDAVNFIKYMILNTAREDWSDLEDSLGRLKFSEFFYKSGEHPEYVEYNEEVSNDIKNIMPRIKKLILEWIRTIEVNNNTSKKEDFEKLIDKDRDLFLSFNYTDTLEKLYNVKPHHIHGSKDSETIEFGHGYIEYYPPLGRFFENTYQIEDRYIGSKEAISDVMEVLRKDTFRAREEHKEFFNNIEHSSITDIYSYGFSFSHVDLGYIKEILKSVNGKEITWHLNFYKRNKDSDIREFINIIEKVNKNDTTWDLINPSNESNISGFIEKIKKIKNSNFEGKFEIYKIEK